MMQQIGAVLGGAPSGRAREPVRRHSRLAGQCEGTFWSRVDRQEVRRVVLAARRYELAGRGFGRRRGPLGHVALEVLELLGNLVHRRTGRLEPSLLYLARTLRRSKDAVWRALRALRDHGFLDWLRRYEPTGVVEGPGPRVRQVSNAYRLSLPERARRLLGWRGEEVPEPDDAVWNRENRAAEVAAQKVVLPLSELPLVEVEDDRLARVLGELGRFVQERESARRSETETKKNP
jgi:hypothetical protein